MKKLLRFTAAAALCSAGLSGLGLLTNAASAAPCSAQTPGVGVAPASFVVGCAYVTVGTSTNTGNCTQAVLEDASGDLGYVGVSNCGRGHDVTGDSGVAGVVGVSSVNGSACDDRWGSPAASNTNGGGCYWVGVAGTVVDLDAAELGETVSALDLVPLPVSGDTSGDYNSTTRDGQGADTCDPADTADDFDDAVFQLLFGPGGLNNPTLEDPNADGDPGVLKFPEC